MIKGKEKIRAVIFDMDGVIVDSEPIHSKSLELLARAYKKNPIYNKQGLLHTVGISGDKGYLEFMKKHKIKESLEILRRKRRSFFVNLLKQKLIPMKGFKQLLTMLKKQDFKIALASNRLLEHVHIIVDNLEIKDKFDVIVGPNRNIRHKPYPDIYLETAKKLKTLPNECIALEDSETGILAAKRAGMKVIVIPNRYTIHHNFSKANLLIKDLSNISIKMICNL